MSAVSLFLCHVDKLGDKGTELGERSAPGGSQSPTLFGARRPAMTLVLMVHCGGIHIPASSGENRQESKGHVPEVS